MKTFPPEQLPLDPAQLIPVLHALADGLTFLRFLTPELITGGNHRRGVRRARARLFAGASGHRSRARSARSCASGRPQTKVSSSVPST